ncbi:hypothetical protein TNCV_1445971, partial [Trichonephila clavipes]
AIDDGPRNYEPRPRDENVAFDLAQHS